MKSTTPAMPDQVANAFDAFPDQARKQLMAIREIIFAVAARSETIGELTETLKWGEPAYLTESSKSGTTVRIACKAADPEYVGLYFNCQTTLVEDMRWTFSDEFIFEGNRAVKIAVEKPLPRIAIEQIIEMALTYHRNKTRHTG